MFNTQRTCLKAFQNGHTILHSPKIPDIQLLHIHPHHYLELLTTLILVIPLGVWWILL